MAGRDQADEQDDVAAPAGHGAEPVAVLAVQALAGVGPDDQQVHRPAGRRCGRQAGQVDRGDLADPQPRVAVPGGHRDPRQHQRPDDGGVEPPASVGPATVAAGQDPSPRAHHAPHRGPAGCSGGTPGRSATGSPARAAAV